MADVFAEDDALDIPVAYDDVETDVTQIDDTPPPQTGKPGTTVECVECGKKVRVRKDGQLSMHACDPKAKRGNRLDKLPDRKSPIKSRTKDFAVGILSWAVEESSASVLARPFDADPEDIPTDLPDADIMVGVPLDVVWPSIPANVQAFIDKLADNSDVIDCGLAWWEWSRQISRWTREQRQLKRALMNGGTDNGTTDTPGQAFGTVHAFVPAEG